MTELTKSEAKFLTKRIKKWVDDMPIRDIEAAYYGQVWLALGYRSWGEWCDGEIGGFNLRAPQRKEVVFKLKSNGMSNRSIAEVTGVNRMTVGRDLKESTVTNVTVDPDRKTVGADGRARKQPQTRTPKPQEDANDQTVNKMPQNLASQEKQLSDIEMGLVLDELTEEDSPDEKYREDIADLSIKYNNIKGKLKDYLGVALHSEAKELIGIHIKGIEDILSIIKECVENGTMDEQLNKILEGEK